MSLKKVLVKLLKEYVILEKIKDDFDIMPTNKAETEPFVMKHYLEAFPTGIKRIYGIYQKSTEGRSMVGVIIYEVPMFTVAKFLEPEVKSSETLELKRLFINDLGIKNLESFVIGQSLKLLKKDEPQIKVVFTFADDTQGHKGIIYQATNAIYLGSSNGKHKYIYIVGGDVNTIKNKVQTLVKPYPKKIQEVVLTYNDIGHDSLNYNNKVWLWRNDDEAFKVLPPNKSHLSQSSFRADFEGRYDDDKKMVSIVDMGSYDGDILTSGDLSNVPQNLIRRLKFEFGDNVRLKIFH